MAIKIASRLSLGYKQQMASKHLRTEMGLRELVCEYCHVDE